MKVYDLKRISIYVYVKVFMGICKVQTYGPVYMAPDKFWSGKKPVLIAMPDEYLSTFASCLSLVHICLRYACPIIVHSCCCIHSFVNYLVELLRTIAHRHTAYPQVCQLALTQYSSPASKDESIKSAAHERNLLS